MGTTTIPGLDVQFNVRAGLISGGFDGLVGSALSRGDVLIFSDVDHRDSQTIYGDLLSEQKLNSYSMHGVTDIHLEIPVTHQYLIHQLETQQIDHDTFIEESLAITTNMWSDEAEARQSWSDLATAITQGGSMSPPIRFHASDIIFTAEQEQEISAQLDKMGFYGNLGDYISIYGGEVGLSQDHDDLYRMISQFRTDNDRELAQRVADEQDPNGKSVIIYGAGHGAKHGGGFWNELFRTRDLDEILRHEHGLKNTRVNVVYDGNDINSNARLRDNSEISYFPEQDTVVAHDTNDNGVVEGAQGYTFGRFPGQ